MAKTKYFNRHRLGKPEYGILVRKSRNGNLQEFCIERHKWIKSELGYDSVRTPTTLKDFLKISSNDEYNDQAYNTAIFELIKKDFYNEVLKK